MGVISKKTYTGSGAHWVSRGQSVSLHQQQMGTKNGSVKQVIDGYLVISSAVNGNYEVQVLDTPAYLGFVGGYVDPSKADPQIEAFAIARFLRGRDEFVEQFRTSPRVQGETGFLSALTEYSPISGGWFASLGVDPAATGNRAAVFALAMKPFTEEVVSHGHFLITPPPGGGQTPHQFFASAYGEFGLRFYVPGRGTVTLDPVPGGYNVDSNDDTLPSNLAGLLSVGDVYGASALGGKYFTQVIQADESPPLINGGYADIVSEANNQPSAWVTIQPLAIDTDEDTFRFMAVAPTVSQANDHDSYGARRLGLFSVGIAFDTQGEVAPSAVNLGYFDMTLFAADARPKLEAAVTNGRKAHYRLNRHHPAYMGRLSATKVAVMLRYSASRSDPVAGTYGTVNDGMFHTVYAYVFDAITGAVAGHKVIEPASSSDYTINQSFWFVHGLGMDSNYLDAEGEVTAVYVGIHPGFYNNPSLDEPRVGIVKVTLSGMTTASYVDVPFIPHATWLPGQFVGTLDELYGFVNIQLRQSMFDVVTYIGNNKFVFPVSTVEGSEFTLQGDVRVFTNWDTILAVYDLSTGGISLAGAIRPTAVGLYADGVIPGRITVVTPEVGDGAGGVDSPATLIASIGRAYGATSMNDTGETFISYDSGVNWEQVSSLGHGRGAMLAGGVTYSAGKTGLEV